MKKNYLSIVLLSSMSVILSSQATTVETNAKEWERKMNNPITTLTLKKYSRNMILVPGENGMLIGKIAPHNSEEIQVGRELPHQEIIKDFYIPIEKLSSIPANDEITIQASEESDSICNQIQFKLTNDKIMLEPISHFLSSSTLCTFKIYNIRQTNIAIFEIIVNHINN